jgi:hypothetical protein
MELAKRWIAEALYRMWLNGVSLVTWFGLRDNPPDQTLVQSGLYFRGSRGNDISHDRPKPILQAFRFPLVAFPTKRGVHVRGRTPSGIAGTVDIEQRSPAPWRRLARLHTNRYGIFEATIATTPRTGFVRARLFGAQRASSVPFSLKRVPDRFFDPFGSTTLAPPPTRTTLAFHHR